MSNWHRLGRTRNCPAGIARYLIRPDGIGVIWCTGTETRREWLWNIDIRTTTALGERMNVRDFDQATEIVGVLPDEIKYCENVIFSGYSRGGAIAVILCMMMTEGTAPCVLFAPKRWGRGGFRFNARHWRGDIVPYLPPFYRSYKLRKFGPCSWPWTAHIRAAKAAARWRHEVTKGGET